MAEVSLSSERGITCRSLFVNTISNSPILGLTDCIISSVFDIVKARSCKDIFRRESLYLLRKYLILETSLGKTYRLRPADAFVDLVGPFSMSRANFMMIERKQAIKREKQRVVVFLVDLVFAAHRSEMHK